MSSPRPLTERAQRFAEAYQGDGVEAATVAGYGGTRASRASIASRLLRDPRVVAILDARRGAGEAVDGPEEPAGPALGVALDPTDTVGALRALAADRATHPSARLRALELLRRWETERDAAPDLATFQADLRARVNLEIRAKHARERAGAACPTCHRHYHDEETP